MPITSWFNTQNGQCSGNSGGLVQVIGPACKMQPVQETQQDFRGKKRIWWWWEMELCSIWRQFWEDSGQISSLQNYWACVPRLGALEWHPQGHLAQLWGTKDRGREALPTAHKHAHKPPAGQTQAVPMLDQPHLSVLRSSACILRQILAISFQWTTTRGHKVLEVRDTVRKLMTELVLLVLRAGLDADTESKTWGHVLKQGKKKYRLTPALSTIQPVHWMRERSCGKNWDVVMSFQTSS